MVINLVKDTRIYFLFGQMAPIDGARHTACQYQGIDPSVQAYECVRVCKVLSKYTCYKEYYFRV